MKATIPGALAFIAILSCTSFGATAKNSETTVAISDTAKIIKMKHAPKPPKSPKVPKEQLRRPIVKDTVKKGKN